jgi:hypothetical protein
MAWPLQYQQQAIKFSSRKEDAMKTALRIMMAILGGTVSAFAYGGTTVEDGRLLTLVFFGFAACIFIFQLVPAAVLFGAMIRGLFPASQVKVIAAAKKEFI